MGTVQATLKPGSETKTDDAFAKLSQDQNYLIVDGQTLTIVLHPVATTFKVHYCKIYYYLLFIQIFRALVTYEITHAQHLALVWLLDWPGSGWSSLM